jgi:hypothetical protein
MVYEQQMHEKKVRALLEVERYIWLYPFATRAKYEDEVAARPCNVLRTAYHIPKTGKSSFIL